MSVSIDDLKDLPYVVILRSEKELRVVEFTGPNAQAEAMALSYSGFEGCVTVAVRIKQTCPAHLDHLMI